MALEFNTIGVKLKYCIETSAGTRPTTGFTALKGIKNIPGMEFSPSQLDVTDLDDSIRRFIPGVIDAGNDVAVTANMTASLKTAWASLVSDAATALASQKSTWFEVAIPNFDSFYFAGIPVQQGLNEIGVDAAMETTLHIIPNQVVGWATAST